MLDVLGKLQLQRGKAEKEFNHSRGASGNTMQWYFLTRYLPFLSFVRLNYVQQSSGFLGHGRRPAAGAAFFMPSMNW